MNILDNIFSDIDTISSDMSSLSSDVIELRNKATGPEKSQYRKINNKLEHYIKSLDSILDKIDEA